MHALALIALIIWIAAFVNAVLNLLLVDHIPDHASTDGPLVSVIIPARDEARAIEKTVRAFLAQDYRALQVVAVDDRSTDGTGAILDRLAAGDSRLMVVHGEAPPPGWLGKPWALQQGAAYARGELVLFVDADITYAPPAVACAVHELQRRDATLLTFLPRMEFGSFWEHIALPMLATAIFVTLPSWYANRSRRVGLALGGGTGNLVRRREYEESGGHQALRSAVVDDIGLARQIRRHGGRTIALRADRLLSLRMYHGAGEIARGFTKNMFAALGRSYWFVLLWLAMGVVCNLAPYAIALSGDAAAIATVGLISLTRLLVFYSLGYRLDNALFGHPLMILFWMGILLRSTWVTGIRGKVTWRGRVYESAPGAAAKSSAPSARS